MGTSGVVQWFTGNYNCQICGGSVMYVVHYKSSTLYTCNIVYRQHLEMIDFGSCKLTLCDTVHIGVE